MKIAIIGGGPAGLRAAEVASAAGAEVTVYEGKPSVGRKFLVAGRGGLNLSKEEPAEKFAGRYSPPEPWPALLTPFGLAELRAWAESLGVETFAASTGRVYPRELKAAPLLRRWVGRLRERGVQFATRHRWCGIEAGRGWRLEFQVEAERRWVEAEAVVLALGGGSWPETGSDGSWVPLLEGLGVAVAPLAPANVGWEVAWPLTVLAAAEGLPLKGVAVRAGEMTVRGELLLTRYGLEGGALYQLGPVLRKQEKPMLVVDFRPELTADRLVAKLGPIRRNFLAEARVRWRLSEAVSAILAAREPFASAEALVAEVKACAIPLLRPRPIAEAISSAGGVPWQELDEKLMLRRYSGLFVAGEMVDWEAPTGGYLIHGCLAMGTCAGLAAAHGWHGPGGG